MAAGRELDIEVLEKVFGAIRVDDIYTRNPSDPIVPGWRLGQKEFVIWDGYKGDSIFTIPPFSSDIAAAWQVVEQLKQRRYTRITIGLQGLGHTVDFCHMEGDYPVCHEVIDGHGHDAFSLPLAICRGALGCVGEGSWSS